MQPLLTQKLVTWFRKNARSLPWREKREPYSIWVSEVMLQQTQVETVIPYYHRFLERFPNTASLAKAELSEVLALWSGLGYYRRAENLWKGSQYLQKHFGGTLPKDPKALLAIPSVGPYTAGAISSIAWNLPSPIVDGNIERVFSRLYGFAHRLPDKRAKDFFWGKAKTWVESAPNPFEINQALMELGAMVCQKLPQCSKCPLTSQCFAFSRNRILEFPSPKKRQDTVKLHWTCYIFAKGNRIYLTRRGSGEWWNGLYDLPRSESQLMPKHFKKKNLSPLEPFHHVVTHHRICVSPVVVPWNKEVVPFPGEWIERDEIPHLPKSSLLSKALARFEHGQGGPPIV